MHLFKFALASMIIASPLALVACSKNDGKQADNAAIVATTPVSGEASTLTENNALHRLQQTLQDNFNQAGIKAKILTIRATEISNIYWVNLEGYPPVMITGDGKYVFQGDVIRLGEHQVYPVSEQLKSQDSKSKLAALNPQDLIVYPATGKTQHIIYVFTDASCPYCHKFHQHLSEINAKGIEVRYVAWPRGPEFMPTMQNIWCSRDRKQAFDQAVKGQAVAASSCANPVMAQYQLGLNMGVNGTPAIYSDSGQYLGGYISPEELLQLLNRPAAK
jgi:thiol:disulfide interchange protein DsbC